MTFTGRPRENVNRLGCQDKATPFGSRQAPGKWRNPSRRTDRQSFRITAVRTFDKLGTLRAAVRASLVWIGTHS